MSAQIYVFLCREDNIGALVHDPKSGACAAIDAPEEGPILKALSETGWSLSDILITHRHSDHVEAVAPLKARFGCRVVDGFGSTENAVVISRIEGTPPGSLGQPAPGVAVYDPETGTECPRAVFDATGRVVNLDECTGELVNTTGTGQFAGYYNDEAATAERMRGGMYWSGDLAYRDADGWIYYAGRTADWLRVDGENLAAAPIERILLRHPAVSEAAVYGVPDPRSGDQLVAALVVTAPLEGAEWERFLAAQPDLGPKAWPRFVRILESLPRTATNKVLKRELQSAGTDEVTWTRAERGTSYS